MATIATGPIHQDGRRDLLSGTPRAHALDRWIFVFMALWFIAIVLTGFIPDSLMKVEMVKAGQRAPFPLVLHFHAVLMGSFMLFLLTQTWLVATGRSELHRRIGPYGALLAAALVVVGFILVPTIYHQVWGGLQAAPPEAKAKMQALNLWLDNIMLLQIRIGIVFAILIALGVRARRADSGFHKRMMIIAPATALPAAFDRISWIPTTMPESPLGPDLYVLFALAPLFAWDVIRNQRIHRAYWTFLAVALPFTVFVHLAWNTPWWHDTAHRLMGV
jgi:hypothetical protein